MFAGKIILGVLLLGAAGTDLKSRRIPNFLILGGLGCFAILAAVLFVEGEAALLPGCLGAGMLAFFIHFIPYRFRCLGAGDVKLAALIGFFLGWKHWLDFLGMYCGVLLAASVVLLFLGKKRPRALPLAPFMAAAYFLWQGFVI